MKFFDYNKIPEGQYLKVIKTNVNTLKGSSNAKILLKFLSTATPSHLQEETYSKQIYPLLNEKTLAALSTLYCLKIGKLENVCETYTIDQGHLSNSSAYETVANLCNNEISSVIGDS